MSRSTARRRPRRLGLPLDAVDDLAEQYGFWLPIDIPYLEMLFAGKDRGSQTFHGSDRAVVVNTFR